MCDYLCQVSIICPYGSRLSADAAVQEGRGKAGLKMLLELEGLSGEPCFHRMLHILYALVCSQWASWLRGSKVSQAMEQLPVFHPQHG